MRGESQDVKRNKAMPTFEDLLWFVTCNKTNKAFRGMTVLQIAYHLKQGLDDGSLWYKEKGGQIVGMILADIDREKKILFVKENLSMSLSTLREFASRARREFVGYTFHYYKHGKHITHCSNQLLTALGV